MAEDSKSRLRLLIGQEGVDLLDRTCVAIFGLGGVGSNCVEALVRGGIGRFVVIDGDTVQPSNINRQAIAYPQTVGEQKSEVTARFIHAINPDAEVFSWQTFIDVHNLSGIMEEVGKAGFNPDYMIDALDTVTTKVALAEYAQSHDIGFISSMGGANKVDPTQFRYGTILKTSVDPLAKAVRKLVRHRGLKDFPVVYSTEPPKKIQVAPLEQLPTPYEIDLATRSDSSEQTGPAESTERASTAKKTDDQPADPDGTQDKDVSVLGTMSYIPPIVGYLLAGYVIRHRLNL